MGVAALLLAAGRSTRMGGPNKLLADLDGVPLVRRAALAALASRARPIVAVTGHQAPAVTAALAGLDLALAHNPDHEAGLASSLNAGLAALPWEADGAVVLLGDMPGVTGALIDALIAAFASHGAIAAVPTHRGAWGNPVLLGRGLFPDLARLRGDAGARRLLEARRAELVEVPVADPAVLLDIDTPEALVRARRGDAGSLPGASEA